MSSMNLNWKLATCSTDCSISDAIKKLNKTSQKIIMVIDSSSKLLGVVTDGDVRRAFLSRVSLNERITAIMNTRPVVARNTVSPDVIKCLMEDNVITAIPIVDHVGRVCGLETLHHLIHAEEKETAVFILAGGFGKRLSPLTDNCPKPMLDIAGLPLLERIVCQVANVGFKKLYISVYHLSGKIIDYFEGGDRWGVSIQYICESKPLGTAGSLSLLSDELSFDSILVINGDVLSGVDFNSLLAFHESSSSTATMCIREHVYTNPFGVVAYKNDKLVNIEEKPCTHSFVSAGIYLFKKEALSMIPANQHYDMPNMLMDLVRSNHDVNVFPIHEQWLDVGRENDYLLAQKQYEAMT